MTKLLIFLNHLIRTQKVLDSFNFGVLEYLDMKMNLSSSFADEQHFNSHDNDTQFSHITYKFMNISYCRIQNEQLFTITHALELKLGLIISSKNVI